MADYQEVRVKLTNSYWGKLKSAAKNKTGTILTINKKNFEDEELKHELIVMIIQATKVRNAFANNMSTDGSFGSGLGNLGGKRTNRSSNSCS